LVEVGLECMSRPTLLAIAPGVPSRPLSNLLALQREEEPETTIALFEATGDALVLGLREGRYDVGLALADAMDASLHSEPLRREAMAIAIPSRLRSSSAERGRRPSHH